MGEICCEQLLALQIRGYLQTGCLIRARPLTRAEWEDGDGAWRSREPVIHIPENKPLCVCGWVASILLLHIRPSVRHEVLLNNWDRNVDQRGCWSETHCISFTPVSSLPVFLRASFKEVVADLRVVEMTPQKFWSHPSPSWFSVTGRGGEGKLLQ